MSAVATDSLLEQLRDRLTSLEGNCLANLEGGIQALVAGDHTAAAVPVTRPVDAHSDDPAVQELGEIFNRMLGRAQAAVEGYNQLRLQLASVLGDHSILEGLATRLHSLNDNCLTNLNDGLHAMTQGDLSIEVTPVTTPIAEIPG